MGSFLAAAVGDDHDAAWVSGGRSEATRKRAAALTEFERLEDLCSVADAIVSICPPGHALEQARLVADTGYAGLYIDANAISPATMTAVGDALPAGYVVDGAVIGGPSTDSGHLYLSGPDAGEAALLFAPDRITVHVLPGSVGAASALKASYALTSKARSALMFAARAAARAAGVEDALLAEWQRTQPGTAADVDQGSGHDRSQGMAVRRRDARGRRVPRRRRRPVGFLQRSRRRVRPAGGSPTRERRRARRDVRRDRPRFDAAGVGLRRAPRARRSVRAVPAGPDLGVGGGVGPGPGAGIGGGVR